MPDQLFLYDYQLQTGYPYSRLLHDVNEALSIKACCFTNNFYDTVLNLVIAIVNKQSLVLLDSDFSEQELVNLGITHDDLTQQKRVIKHKYTSTDELIRAVSEQQDWELTLFTSGTTGIPKQVKHKLAALNRAVRISEKHKDDVWGFAYNPTHIAGLQVFFQALLNGNTIINLFNADRKNVLELITNHKITNLSATPTFYRLLLPLTETFPCVKSLTSGGEKFDPSLSAQLAKAFPHARLHNVYASTEAGTILEAKGDVFSIKDETLCRIANSELLIHKSLMGESNELILKDSEWYATGDLVEIISEKPLLFRFLSRSNEMVNVGGYKVNPFDTEQQLQTHPHIRQAYVYGKANPVLGNILIADVVTTEAVTEKELREFLSPLLQPYKIPRIINFVSSIELTRSGKLKRT
jgi:acyl-coenzyme A synthetase/AMP-(fatty) acid ligase